MNEKLKNILENALSMPQEQRAFIAGRLINSLDENVDDDVETAWQNEIQKGAHFVEHRIDHAGVETTVALSVGISKLIDFMLYFHDNAQSSAKKKFQYSNI